VRIEVHHYLHFAEPVHPLEQLLQVILTKVNAVMTTQAELAAALNDLKATIDKIGAESTATLQKVADLETALANAGTVDTKVQEAFDALKASVKAVDDLVPDAPAADAPTV
jgi:chromosome segregation ATPase